MAVIGGTDELVELLGNTPIVLRQVAAGMSPASARTRDRGGWSAVEIVGHLIDVERRAIDRIGLVMAEENPIVTGFDPNESVYSRGYQDQGLNDLLATFVGLRGDRLALLAELEPSDWQRGCTRDGISSMSLTEITTHSCNHDVNHIAQIARLRQEME